MSDEKNYSGLEIIGELRDYTFNIDFTRDQGRIPSIDLRFKRIGHNQTLTWGDEASRQLKKLGPDKAKGRRMRTYARCRVDFYVEDDTE
jgi:hypothetical protein